MDLDQRGWHLLLRQLLDHAAKLVAFGSHGPHDIGTDGVQGYGEEPRLREQDWANLQEQAHVTVEEKERDA